MPPDPTTGHYCDALYRAETAEARVARLEAEVERLRAAMRVAMRYTQAKYMYEVLRRALGANA